MRMWTNVKDKRSVVEYYCSHIDTIPCKTLSASLRPIPPQPSYQHITKLWSNNPSQAHYSNSDWCSLDQIRNHLAVLYIREIKGSPQKEGIIFTAAQKCHKAGLVCCWSRERKREEEEVARKRSGMSQVHRCTAVLILACHLVVTRAGSSKDKLEASWWSFTPGMLTKWQTLLDDEIQLVLITRTTLYTFTPWIQMNTQATAYVWGTEQVYFWKSKTKSCRC